ncbi:MAG TPA: sigma-54 dependent transcriptional regulator [Gemmatimonadaceae bacterium]|jgi:DNA-binding NtrC family response regulator|nr:sigma-54 dependent transcriptional regulator [Gemmatimonadaceae bacterium]
MKQQNAKVLIADDEQAITAGLSAILSDEGYAVEVVPDGQKALEQLSSDRYGVVLADLKMPKLDGLSLLRELQQRQIPTECIIITGQATVDSAVQAMQQGAYDYIEKPLNAEKLNRLKALIPKAIDKFNVQQKNRELTSKLEGLTHYGELTGQSDSMREVYQIIDAVAPSTASVLILGESGTGKELVARAVHSKSDRAKGPFFALNCAALPKEILENELFGHEKGAFTGSTNEKPGAFEMASSGTIFLDEVAEMSPDIQVKLLRALETRQVRRLGGKKEIQVDIRIVAATNKDLQKAIAEGELREDLYYRLAVVQIDLPPLRERSQDVQLLANEFLQRYASQNGKQIADFETAAWDWILSYTWPGNVRELKNAVERSVIMARGEKITVKDIMPPHLRNAPGAAASVTIAVGSSMSDARRQMTLSTFASTNGDVARTAKLLGVTEEDVRRDMLALLDGERDRSSDGDTDGGAESDSSNGKHGRTPEDVPVPRPGGASAAKKPAPKKR